MFGHSLRINSASSPSPIELVCPHFILSSLKVAALVDVRSPDSIAPLPRDRPPAYL